MVSKTNPIVQKACQSNNYLENVCFDKPFVPCFGVLNRKIVLHEVRYH